MSVSAAMPSAAALPQWVRRRSPPVQVALLALGVVAVALASKISVPMTPVPMTLQTFAVTLVGGLLGWRLGGLCLIAYLLAGAAGLPVFSGTAAGLAKLQGPTAGYLFAFPLAAAAVGVLVEGGWARASLARLCAAMLIGSAICLIVGAAWLAASVGAEAALAKGVTPFLPGAALKSLLSALCLKAAATAFGRP
ncbi:BioY protein [uncultured Alphaproteobacteria bacterium]|uniref:Biotin transporter n=1 Tax=uncultured Alphaproteobacteria bacterium TaxID=91750 RepID=A0A212KGX8_9PROT|nr:BioY protein [uncultured Alphaproteobacteria bacterium]